MSNLPFQHSYRVICLNQKTEVDADLVSIQDQLWKREIDDTKLFSVIHADELTVPCQLQELAYREDFYEIGGIGYACFGQNGSSPNHRAKNGPEILFLKLKEIETRNNLRFAFIEKGYLDNQKGSELDKRVLFEKMKNGGIEDAICCTTEYGIEDFPILALYQLQKSLKTASHDY